MVVPSLPEEGPPWKSRASPAHEMGGRMAGHGGRLRRQRSRGARPRMDEAEGGKEDQAIPSRIFGRFLEAGAWASVAVQPQPGRFSLVACPQGRFPGVGRPSGPLFQDGPQHGLAEDNGLSGRLHGGPGLFLHGGRPVRRTLLHGAGQPLRGSHREERCESPCRRA